MAIYYFDVSDAGPTDPDSKWVNDANAFDGDTTTQAQSAGTNGTDSFGYLLGEGTNAPSSGNTIDVIQVRINSSGAGSVQIYTNGLAESLGTLTVSTGGQQWSNPLWLNKPSGGWSYNVVQALEIKLYETSVGISFSVYRVEIEVNPTLATHFYLKQGFS